MKIDKKTLEAELIKKYPHIIPESKGSKIEYYDHESGDFKNPVLIGVYDKENGEFTPKIKDENQGKLY